MLRVAPLCRNSGAVLRVCVCVYASVSVCVCVALRQRGSSVQCLCVRLAFQLKTHTDAKEVSLESLDAPQQEVHESRDATYVLVPTTLDV